ncbi:MULTISPECIES: UvrY/SirA/GacA family response regulator transcription factor [Halomonadaceae]|uniref:Two-component system response regulator UvrY n=4 Tax=Halomonadaceae TaxID=28256 RepID=A0A060BE40_9GAMM|nr:MULTISPECIES: UvrY/SirA/GacA family response regulator transcription factor [Halomonas]AIA75570.1 response regulator [Halomonas campaniensis]MBR9927015.1 UvrY/SirA/GacA family response regulator transcription factor [Gammaproteobacteria bacterium]ASK19272.1 DNA-binding response regulator [Halomonas sp. N3-2A]AYF35583.1 two-component system response regulator UvrY [Halomonas alkaliphila]AZM95377.1 two-component system response regulator UvrY [Halomonas venusta]
MIKVLIADDHHLVRTSIAHLLNEECDIKVVGEVDDGESAVAQCRRLKPDIVVMDIRMPGIGGLEATRRIHRTMEDVKVLILTAHIEDSALRLMLEAGAIGFLSKGADTSEMTDAIRQVFHGKRYVSQEIAQRLALSHFTDEDNPFRHLSHRELQIALMIVNCQRVQDISDRLHLSPKTVNTYRYRLFDKLEVATDVELTHLALRHGLVEGFDAMLG